MLFFYFFAIVRKWEKWNKLRFLNHFSIFSFFAKNRKMEKKYIYSHHFFVFSIVFKKWKNRKIVYLSPNFHNFILVRKMKKWQVLRAIVYFSIFLINRKTFKTIHPLRQFFFFYFIEKMAQKSEKLWIFNGEEKKNLIRIHLRLTNLVRRSRGSEWGGGGGSICRLSVKIQLLGW